MPLTPATIDAPSLDTVSTQDLFREILLRIGEDPTRDGLLRTPERMEKSMAFLTRGYGGQLVCLVPDLALTVAITSDPTQPARSEGYFGTLLALIADTLIPEAEAAA